jgi:hypothetical protein
LSSQTTDTPGTTQTNVQDRSGATFQTYPAPRPKANQRFRDPPAIKTIPTLAQHAKWRTIFQAVQKGIWPPPVTSTRWPPRGDLENNTPTPPPPQPGQKHAKRALESVNYRGFWALQGGQRSQPGSGRVLWAASQTCMAPRAGGCCPRAPGSPPPAQPAPPGCGPPPACTPPPWTAAAANTASTNHNPKKRPKSCCGEVPHRSTADHRPGQPRHRHPRPRPGQVSRTRGSKDLQDGVRSAAGAAGGTAAGTRGRGPARPPDGDF